MNQLNIFVHAPGREMPAGARPVRDVGPGEPAPVEDCDRCGVPCVAVSRAWNATRSAILALCVACTRKDVAVRAAAGLPIPPGFEWALGTRGR